MIRKRITTSKLVRSTDHTTNSKIVRKSKQQMKRIESTRTIGTFIKNAFGTKGRFIYIGT
jgi:hypothetical protein